MATHTNKKDDWVDTRARETYENYYERLGTLQANSSQDSTFDVHQVYSTTKLHAWKEAARRKSKGRIYGTIDMASTWLVTSTKYIQQPNFMLGRKLLEGRAKVEFMAR